MQILHANIARVLKHEEHYCSTNQKAKNISPSEVDQLVKHEYIFLYIIMLNNNKKYQS